MRAPGAIHASRDLWRPAELGAPELPLAPDEQGTGAYDGIRLTLCAIMACEWPCIMMK